MNDHQGRLGVFFLIRSLEVGGAERQLVLLAAELHRSGRCVEVCVMFDRGPLAAELEEADVPVIYLRKRGRWDVLSFGLRLASAIRHSKAQLLHGYTTVPNVLLTLMRVAFPRRRVIWGIRASMTDVRHYGWVPRVAFKVSCWLSRYADLAIANSARGASAHRAAGYRPRRLVVIPNGVDVTRFRPDPVARMRWRQNYGIANDVPVIGLVGRLDPAKGHTIFVQSIGILLRQGVCCLGVCVGPGEMGYWKVCKLLAEECGAGGRIRWLGPSNAPESVYNGIDVLCLPSTSEGFPNVVAEAMACGLRCVVSDVGDAASVVGDLGQVVPAGDSAALAEALKSAVSSDRTRGAMDRRKRIAASYSSSLLADRTWAAFVDLADQH